MIFHDVEQGSDSWWALRRGVITASRAHRILTPKTCKPSAQQDDLICELIGETLSLIPPERVENYTSRAMAWGVHCEEEARRFFCMERNVNVTNGGFCLTDDGRYGASPDFFVADGEGVGELKAPQATTQAKYLLAGTLPDDYRPQCHMHLIVTGRKYCEWMSYCPGMPPLLIRVEPDAYTIRLKDALDEFYPRYQAALALVRGEQPPAPQAPTPPAGNPDVIALWKRMIDDAENDAALDLILQRFKDRPKDMPERKAIWALFLAFAAQQGRVYSTDLGTFVAKESPYSESFS